MNDQLVDSSGFPRSDIDLVVVRTARSNIIRKSTGEVSTTAKSTAEQIISLFPSYISYVIFADQKQ